MTFYQFLADFPTHLVQCSAPRAAAAATAGLRGTIIRPASSAVAVQPLNHVQSPAVGLISYGKRPENGMNNKFKNALLPPRAVRT